MAKMDSASKLYAGDPASSTHAMGGAVGHEGDGDGVVVAPVFTGGRHLCLWICVPIPSVGPSVFDGGINSIIFHSRVLRPDRDNNRHFMIQIIDDQLAYIIRHPITPQPVSSVVNRLKTIRNPRLVRRQDTRPRSTSPSGIDVKICKDGRGREAQRASGRWRTKKK
jgi:hypothetical protein